MVALSVICLALVALLAYREWGARRDREAFERRMAEQRAEALEERRELYQRIQAPEIAVADAHRERRGPYVRRQPIAADDDAAFARQREQKAERNGEVDNG